MTLFFFCLSFFYVLIYSCRVNKTKYILIRSIRTILKVGIRRSHTLSSQTKKNLCSWFSCDLKKIGYVHVAKIARVSDRLHTHLRGGLQRANKTVFIRDSNNMVCASAVQWRFKAVDNFGHVRRTVWTIFGIKRIVGIENGRSAHHHRFPTSGW